MITVAAGCGVRAAAKSPSASKPRTLRRVRCARSRSTIPLCGSSADFEASCCLHQPGKEPKIVAVLGVPLDRQPERPLRIFDRLDGAIGCPGGGDKPRVGGNRLMVVAADLQMVAHQLPDSRVSDRRYRNPTVGVSTW